jgi:hypothetical protein
MTHHDKARELVKRLLRQKTTDEMERYEVINADFEGAYDLLVRDCRNAADTITAQSEENRRLREAILREAAAICKRIRLRPDLSEDERVGVLECALALTDEANAARAALSSGEGE